MESTNRSRSGQCGIGGIVAQHPAVEHVGEWRERHRRALVAAVGGQWAVHGHSSHEGDRELVLFRSQSHAGEGTRPVRPGGSRVKGTMCHGPWSTRQWANTVPVRVELELTAHQAVGELAGFHRERADVASDLLAVLAETAPEHHLEHTAAGFVLRTEDQADRGGA